MTALSRFSAACKPPPFQTRREISGMEISTYLHLVAADKLLTLNACVVQTLCLYEEVDLR
jgi:hypothetical protein